MRIPHDDRRRAPRFNVTVPIRYRILTDISEESRMTDSIQVYERGAQTGGGGGMLLWQDKVTRNLGSGGVCIHTETYLKPDTVLEIELSRPGKSSVKALAKVVWSHPGREVTGHLTGIEYVVLRSDFEAALADCTAEFLAEELAKNPAKVKERAKHLLSSILQSFRS